MTDLPSYLLAEPTILFCEDNLHGLIAQPANSISGLVIMVAGFYILLRKKRHDVSSWLGVTAMLVGLTTFAYHASFTFIGQLLDLGSMFLLASFLILAALRNHSLQRGARATVVLAGTLLPLVLTATIRTVEGFNFGIPLFAILLITAIYLELRAARQNGQSLRLYGVAFTIFLLGWAIWWLDITHVWCDPASSHIINGHAIWHVANAFALLVLDNYYASEQQKKKTV